MYCDFEEEQYMSIFAMALPYTDCHKYSVYIVTMAHQVIADWFTRCKLIFRKDFVSLIVAALRTNNNSNNKVDSEANSNKENQELQKDMTDVCLDMMARYSFSLHHGQQKRSPLVDFLLSQGSSQTWLVGNVLVTVTTSDSESQSCDCFKWKRKQSPQHQQPQNQINRTDTLRTHYGSTASVGGAEDVFLRKKRPLSATSSLKGDRIAATAAARGDADSQTDTVFTTTNTITNATSKPIHLVKLTQKIVEQNDSFSPSEKLLFSRQGSKVVADGIVEGNESESTSTDDDDDDDDETTSHSDDRERDESNGNCVSNDDHNNDGVIGSMEDPIFLSDAVNAVVENKEAKPPTTVTLADTAISTSSTMKPLRMPLRVGELNGSMSHSRPSSISEPLVRANSINQQQQNQQFRDEVSGSMPPPKFDCWCVCSGWAEIVVQRPSGKISWVMKLENREVMKGDDFADLMLLKNCLDRDATPSISGLLFLFGLARLFDFFCFYLNRGSLL